MKKLFIIILISLLAATLVLAISGLSREQRVNYNLCKKDCATSKMLDKRECNTLSTECRNSCNDIKDSSSGNITNNYSSCRAGCASLNFTGLNLSDIQIRNQTISCQRNCTATRRDETASARIEFNACNKNCSDSKNDCKKQANDDFTTCGDICYGLALDPGNYTNNSTNSTGNLTNSTDD